MKRLWSLMTLALALTAGGVWAQGEVTFGAHVDEEGDLWVTLSNSMNRTIVLESVTVRFLDARNRVVARDKLPCRRNCQVGPGDSKDFGPISVPAGARRYEVYDVYYHPLADVEYVAYVDKQNRVWVTVTNNTDRDVAVERVVIEFYDKDGRRIRRDTLPCMTNCRVRAGDSKDFGPIVPPGTADAYRVRDVFYRSL